MNIYHIINNNNKINLIFTIVLHTICHYIKHFLFIGYQCLRKFNYYQKYVFYNINT